MSGLNFYLRQANGGTTKGKTPLRGQKKVKKRLKSEWLADIANVLGKDVAGLDKCTIKTLENLLGAIKDART